MAETTTVSIPKKLKRNLDVLKENPRETYSDVIGRLVACASDDEADLELSEKTLEKIGFSKNQAKVYMALIKSGTATAGTP